MVGERYLVILFWVLINNSTWTISSHSWSRTAASLNNWNSRLPISSRAIPLRIEVVVIFWPSVYRFRMFALCIIELILLWWIWLHAGFWFNSWGCNQSRSESSSRQPRTHPFAVSWFKVNFLLFAGHDPFPCESTDVLFVQLIYIHHSVTRTPLLLHWWLRASFNQRLSFVSAGCLYWAT